MTATDDDRAEHDGDVDYTQSERDALAAAIEAVDEAKDLFVLEVAAAARKYGEAALKADPKFVVHFNTHARKMERGIEAVGGFVDYVAACANDMASELKDHEEISKAELIVETGRD